MLDEALDEALMSESRTAGLYGLPAISESTAMRLGIGGLP